MSFLPRGSQFSSLEERERELEHSIILCKVLCDLFLIYHCSWNTLDQFLKGHYYFISCLCFYTIVFLSYSEETYIVHTHLHTISDSFTLTLGIKDGEVEGMY